MENNFIREDETFDALNIHNLNVLQKKQGFRFAIDAVLLAHFARFKKGPVADVGTGSGVIALLLKAYQPHLKIDAFDIQPAMIDMLSRTLACQAIEGITPICADITQLSGNYYDQYAAIVTNPPYFPIQSGKISPLPEVALARHEISCDLDTWLKNCARLLKSSGHLFMIHRAERLNDILLSCAQYHLAPVRLRMVHSYMTEEASLLLIEAVKNQKPTLKILPPLAIYDENGYTAEIMSYYEGEKI